MCEAAARNMRIYEEKSLPFTPMCVVVARDMRTYNEKSLKKCARLGLDLRIHEENPYVLSILFMCEVVARDMMIYDEKSLPFEHIADVCGCG